MTLKPKLAAAFVLLVSLSFLPLSFTAFVSKMNRDLQSSVSKNMIENAAQSDAAITAKMDENTSVLRALATFLGEHGNLYDKAAADATQAVLNSHPFLQISVADLHGDSITNDGLKRNIAASESFRQAVNGNCTVTDSEPFSNVKKAFLYSVPIYSNQKIIGVLSGTASADGIVEQLDSPLYQGKATRLLIRKDGTVVLYSKKAADSVVQNFYSSLKCVKPDKMSVEALKEQIGRNSSGTAEFNVGGIDSFVYYQPLSAGNWYLITIVPSNVILPQSNYMIRISSLLAFSTAFAFILLGFYAVFLLRKKNSAIEKSIRELSVLTSNIPGCVQRCKYDGNLTIIYCSDGFYYLTGYSREEIAGLFDQQFLKMIYPRDREAVKHSIDEQLHAGSVIDIQYRIQKKDGTLVWILERGQLMVESGKEPELYSLLIDITEQRVIMQELEISNERYQIVMDQSDSMIFDYDILNKTILNSTGGRQISCGGYAIRNFPESFLNTDVVHPDDAEAFRQMFESVRNGEPSAEGECRMKSENGDYLWYNIKITTIFSKEGKAIRAIGRISDITCQKEATQRLLFKAQRDGLTELLNKIATQNLIEQALNDNEPCALYMIDVDHFKEVNDNLGHMFGDAVLADIGSKLKKLFRTTDILGRIGGDEFMVLMKNVDDPALIVEKAMAITQCLQQTFNTCYSISGSVGVALFPKDGKSYAELYQKADIALYEAKRGGRNRFVLFHGSADSSEACPEQGKKNIP
ncbi:MAG: Putative diguanylate cyclase YegE [Eubacteriales bacterium]